jgi:uncharacterized protein YdeI (YjbR/CyaY-like superfamily)
MIKKEVTIGQMHKLPTDLRVSLTSNKRAQEAWESITTLARNEWICWIESAKKSETRNHRITRTLNELKEGKRRPCCWAGCIHRFK